MKQLTIISGKGGTGKTTIAACFAQLAKNKIMADCDVDAPNLHLVLEADKQEEKDFSGAKVAVIDLEKCKQCGKCVEVCRFQAIGNLIMNNLKYWQINSLKCEGCAACFYACPQGAVNLVDEITGKTFLSQTSQGKFSHALLGIGAEGSGKLVTEVRKGAYSLKETEDLMIIDGSPGIGCSVIASITGCHAVLVISEPTQSGLHDLSRVAELAEHFGIRVFLVINKYNLNQEVGQAIERFAKENRIEVVGRVPFDPLILKALQQGKSLMSYESSPAAQAIQEIWEKINKIMKEE